MTHGNLRSLNDEGGGTSIGGKPISRHFSVDPYTGSSRTSHPRVAFTASGGRNHKCEQPCAKAPEGADLKRQVQASSSRISSVKAARGLRQVWLARRGLE